MTLLRPGGSRKVASVSGPKGFWLGDRKVGSQVIGKTKADSLGEEQLGKLGKNKEEPAIERRGEYKDLRLDFGGREKQVACHVSTLALAKINEACRQAEM